MDNVACIDQLLTALRKQSITFQHIPDSPINVPNLFSVDQLVVSRIVARYVQYGFAVVELELDPAVPETLLVLGEVLKLGEPFIPPLYEMGPYMGAIVTKIASQADEKPLHPSFDRVVGLKLHTDGTLQKIGYVKTAMLLCKSPGSEGGDTTLFNTSAALAALVEIDVSAAIALAHSGVLRRQANINDCYDINDGPAYAVQDGQLVCAYSVTETDSWITAEGVDEMALQRGIDFLYSVAQLGSPYFAQLRLVAGQAIILANSAISHGRTPYRDTDSCQRCLYRSLYLKRPKVM